MADGMVVLELALSDDDVGTEAERTVLLAIEADLVDVVEGDETAAWLGHEWGGGAFVVSFEADDPKALLARLDAAVGDGVPAGSTATVYADDDDEEGVTTPFPAPRAHARPKKPIRSPAALVAELVEVPEAALRGHTPGAIWAKLLAVGGGSGSRAERVVGTIARLVGAERGEAVFFVGAASAAPVPAQVAAVDARDASALAAALDQGAFPVHRGLDEDWPERVIAALHGLVAEA